MERSGSSITEGIGQGRITDNLKDAVVRARPRRRDPGRREGVATLRAQPTARPR